MYERECCVNMNIAGGINGVNGNVTIKIIFYFANGAHFARWNMARILWFYSKDRFTITRTFLRHCVTDRKKKGHCVFRFAISMLAVIENNRLLKTVQNNIKMNDRLIDKSVVQANR